MSPLHLSDLPPDARRRATAQAGLAGQAGAKTRHPSTGGVTSGGRWRCHGCGDEFARWVDVDRHGAPGHRRFDCVVDG